MDVVRVLRNVGNVANLSTPLGLVVAAAGRGRLRIADGLVIAERVRLPGIRASAMTIGCVVLVPGRTLEEAAMHTPGLLDHEDQHAHQWAYCLGLPFIGLYAAGAAWSWLRSGDRATANYFEKQAGLGLGGYPSRETRPAREGVRVLSRAVAALLSGAVAPRNAQPGAGNATSADA